MSDINSLYLTIAVVAIVAAMGLYGVFYNLKRARVIEDTPTSKIRSASQGYAELSGFAKPADGIVLHSPLSGKACLWYRYKIERYERSGKSSSWRTVEKNTSNNLFALEDTTGVCYLYPNKAEFSSDWKDQWKGSSKNPLNDMGATGLLALVGGSRYRYTEERIHENDFLYALGMFQTTRAPSPLEQAKQNMADILFEWKQDYDQLLERFDSDSDGKIDMAEWENARKAAFSQAKEEAYKNHNHQEIHTLTRPPKNQPFIISNKDPQKLSSRYRWQACGMGIVFIAASGLAVHLLQRIL